MDPNGLPGEGREPDRREAARVIEWRQVLPLAAALALGLGTVAAVPLLARPLALLIISITFAQALAPVVTFLERRWRRKTAVVLIYCVLFLCAAIVVWALAPPLMAQATAFVEGIPEILQQLRNALSRFDPLLAGRIEDMSVRLSARADSLMMALPIDVLTALLELLFIVFLSVYWLAGTPELLRFTLSLVPRTRRDEVERVLQHMGRAMGGYVRGALINAVIMGVLAFVGLAIIGVPFPVVLGVLTMIGELVPIIGPIIVGAVVVVVSLTHSLSMALFAGLLFTVLQQLEGQVLTPKIMESQTRVPAALVLFAIVAGGAVGGLLGILVAVPTAAALRVLIVELIAPAQRRWSGITKEPAGKA
jgi:predicted PurR-regulated permease PerM